MVIIEVGGKQQKVGWIAGGRRAGSQVDAQVNGHLQRQRHGPAWVVSSAQRERIGQGRVAMSICSVASVNSTRERTNSFPCRDV